MNILDPFLSYVVLRFLPSDLPEGKKGGPVGEGKGPWQRNTILVIF
jgi:hypothetical protein